MRTIEEFAEILKTMYEDAPKKEQVVNIHLFGIEYGEEIIKAKFSASKIINTSGLKKSYITELSKGVKLSKFVTLKK